LAPSKFWTGYATVETRYCQATVLTVLAVWRTPYRQKW